MANTDPEFMSGVSKPNWQKILTFFFLFFFSTQLNLIYRWGPFAYSKDIQNFQGGGGGGGGGGESIFFQRDPNAYSYRNL